MFGTSSHDERGIVRICGLGAEHGSRQVLTDVTFSLTPGAVTAIVGPNGCGKSTCLRTVARLHRRSDGTVTVDAGQDVQALSPKDAARRISLLVQHHGAPAGLSVRDVVAMGRHPHRGRWGAGLSEADRDVVERALTDTGTVEFAHRSLHELSGGEQQRVWIACCLAQDTDVVLLDEPTNHLDLRHQADVLDLLADLAQRGRTVGVVLHDLNHAADVADQVVLMSAGNVVAAGPAEAVLTSKNLSQVYDVPVAVHTDPITGVLTARPQRSSRLRAASA